MTLTFDTQVASFTQLVDCKYKIKVHNNSPQCCIQSFMTICLLVMEKKIFKGVFFTVYGKVAILVM